MDGWLDGWMVILQFQKQHLLQENQGNQKESSSGQNCDCIKKKKKPLATEIWKTKSIFLQEILKNFKFNLYESLLIEYADGVSN